MKHNVVNSIMTEGLTSGQKVLHPYPAFNIVLEGSGTTIVSADLTLEGTSYGIYLSSEILNINNPNTVNTHLFENELR